MGRGKLLSPERRRSTQRHATKGVDIEEAKLRRRLWEIAAEHIPWGRRMAYRLLRREGWLVNHKRVHRLWREEGLQRPTPRRQKRARPADGSVRRHQAVHPHQVWAMDFQFDATADGRRLKFLNVIDEHNRLCLTNRVGRRCKAKDVVAVLEELTSLYPAPAFIRSDNGPEFIAQALRKWCQSSGSMSCVADQRAETQHLGVPALHQQSLATPDPSLKRKKPSLGHTWGHNPKSSKRSHPSLRFWQ